VNRPVSFTASLWRADVEDAAWVFVTVPLDLSDEIAESAPTKAGFGSVRVEVTIGSTTWRTSLFPDTKRGAYILPVKKAVRRAESVEVGDEVRVDLKVLSE
jgi:hypothetical protein